MEVGSELTEYCPALGWTPPHSRFCFSLLAWPGIVFCNHSRVALLRSRNKTNLSSFKFGNIINMKTRLGLLIMLSLALALPVTLMVACKSTMQGASSRPQGPCDIYAAA